MSVSQALSFHKCSNECCSLIIKKNCAYQQQVYDDRNKFKRNKAGILFYDPQTDKVLLVQSRGEKWGFAKGTMEDCDATIEDCAIREVWEETGLKISKDTLMDAPRHRVDRATYFYLERDTEELSGDNIPYSVFDNDASGITWIKVECLKKMVENGELNLNSHCKKLLLKIFKINLTK